jgi:PAS domain S-box-containing protein
MRKEEYKHYRKNFILGVIQTIGFSIAISLIMVWAVNVWVGSTIENEQKKQRENLIRMVSFASKMIEPYRNEVINDKVSPEEGLTEVRNVLRRLTYTDQYGPNYLFMSDYNGTMLVQPFEPDKEGTNQWELKDTEGVFIIQELVRSAQEHPEGSFVTYSYYPPNSDIPQVKLSYVIGLPELNAYLGTGMYQDQYYLEQQALVKQGRNILLVLITLMTLSSSTALYRSYKNNKQLHNEIEQREIAQQVTDLSEQNLLTVFNSIHDAIIIHDFDGNILEVNDRTLKMFEVNKDEALELSIRELSSPKSLRKENLHEIWEETKSKGSQIIEWKCIIPNTQNGFFAEVSLRVGNWYGDQVILAVIRDISQRKLAEREFKRNQRLLEHSQQLAQIGNYNYIVETGELNWSKGLFNIHGINPENGVPSLEMRQKIILNNGWEMLEKLQLDVSQNKQQNTAECQIIRSDGTIRDLFIIMDWIEDDEQNLSVHMGTIQDITEQKRAEKQILQEVKKLAGLRKIDIQIINHVPINNIFETVLSLVKEILNADACSILLLDEKKDALSNALSYGFQDNKLNIQLSNSDTCLPWQVINNRNKFSITLNEFKNLSCAHLINKGFRSYIGIPIIAFDEVFGILEILFKTDIQISKETFDYCELLAGQTAIAIDTTNLITSLQQTNQEVINAYEATIAGWSRALEIRDEETKGHSDRVMWLACQLAEHFDIRDDNLTHFRRGVFLHDIGKMGIPDSILLKPGPLTESEWEIMKQHPSLAYRILSEIPYLKDALDIPFYHHERWDGSGYPEGLKGDEIPLPARIFAVIDVWDALTSDRPYRPAWPHNKALDYIEENAGTHFDPKVVRKFITLIRKNQNLK